MSNTNTKKQHYIPQSILKHFSLDGKSIYECIIDWSPPKLFKTNIRNAMCQNNIYEHMLLEKNGVENFFATEIDSALSEYHKDVCEILDAGSQEAFDKVYNLTLKQCPHILISFYRSGALLEEYNTAYEFEQGKIIVAVLSAISGNYIDKLSKTLQEGYKFSILVSDDLPFIIGDQYLSTIALKIKSNFFNVSNRNIGIKDTMLILPISKKYCVIFYHGENVPEFVHPNKICNITNNELLSINTAIKRSSYKKIAGSNMDMISTIVENDTHKESVSPTTFIAGYPDGNHRGYVNKKEAFFYDFDYEVKRDLIGWNFTLGRNDPCPCGSGKKHKKCCIEKTKVIKEIYKSFDRKNTYDFRIDPRLISEKPIPLIQPQNDPVIEELRKSGKLNL